MHVEVCTNKRLSRRRASASSVSRSSWLQCPHLLLKWIMGLCVVKRNISKRQQRCESRHVNPCCAQTYCVDWGSRLVYSHQSERAILGNALLFASSRPALILCDVGSTELPSPEQRRSRFRMAETTACCYWFSFISETWSTQSSLAVCLVMLRLAGFCLCGPKGSCRVRRGAQTSTLITWWCLSRVCFAFMTFSVISCNSIELMSAELQCFM